MSSEPSSPRPGGGPTKGSEPPADAHRTEVLGRQSSTARSDGPATGPSAGPATSGSMTAVKDAPRATSAPPAKATPSAPVPTDTYSNGSTELGGTELVGTELVGTDLGATVVTAVPTSGAGAVRRARLTVSQLDPWSVMKMSFVLSLAGGIVLIVCVWLMWLLLSNGDVFVSIDKTVGDIAGSGSTISVVEIFSLRRVMGIALMLAVVQVVLVTALATLAAFLYNLSAGLVGGFEVTLSEES